MNILTIVGARPQFVKAATLSLAFKNSSIQESILHTGQHYDSNMSEIFFEEMGIPKPTYRLKTAGGSSHGVQVGKMLIEIEEILMKDKPDYVLVYGDTNSTLAGALAAKKIHIPVIHVEAGLRSFNEKMPEEVNRILTDRISEILFCPSKAAVQNLKNEGFDHLHSSYHLVGDIMYDSTKVFSEQAKKSSTILSDLNIQFDFILCTIHRAETTDHPDKLRELIESINHIHKKHPVVLPLHPRTKKIIEQLSINLDAFVIPPVSYFDMLRLLDACCMVMTDSGGLQKEAYFFQKPCLILREETEWTELLDFYRLTGSSKSKIIETYEEQISNQIPQINLFGDGSTAEQIVELLQK